MRPPFRCSALAPLAFLLFALVSSPAAAADARRFAVHAQHLIDGRSNAARGASWVVVSGDTIESVQSSPPAGLDVVELGDATLLPGLIDCHTHLSSRVGLERADRFKSTAARSAITGVVNCRNTLMAGITTCRDVGGGELVDVGLRDAIAAGEIPGPRMQVATWALSMTGGHGDPQNAVNYHASSGNPFLHTWSLAVEQQFYVLWPLLFALIGRIYGASGVTPRIFFLNSVL